MMKVGLCECEFVGLIRSLKSRVCLSGRGESEVAFLDISPPFPRRRWNKRLERGVSRGGYERGIRESRNEHAERGEEAGFQF